MIDFADFLGKNEIEHLNKLHLITTLCPGSLDQIKKIRSLISLVELPDIRNKRVNCQISINNRLHGKVYIFKKSDSYISAIVSSANFTNSGLIRNHEWGIEISDKVEIKKLESAIIDNVEFDNLSFEDIYKMQRATSDFMEQQLDIEEQNIALNLIQFIVRQKWTTQLDDTTEFWFKPIGVSTAPVSEDRLFSELQDNLHFSKQRPRGVKPNDIIICYGVGTTKMLSIYKATSFPIKATDEEIEEEGEWLERWPWYVEAQNLTPNFGITWAKHSLYKNALLEEFLAIYPDAPVTATGKQTLGALNFGKDKLKLAPEFAKFVISKIVTINDREN